MLGTSFGVECALLIGVLSDHVDAVVAFAPSDVVWAGVRAGGRVTSHWTYGGVPVPCVPFAEGWKADRRSAGGDDQVWPAVEHTEWIRDRRAAHGLATTLVTDSDAGHRTILPGELSCDQREVRV